MFSLGNRCLSVWGFFGEGVESGHPVKTFSYCSLGQADNNYFLLASNTVTLCAIVSDKTVAQKVYIHFWNPDCFLQLKWLLSCAANHTTRVEVGMAAGVLQQSPASLCTLYEVLLKLLTFSFQKNKMLWDVIHCDFLLLNSTLFERINFFFLTKEDPEDEGGGGGGRRK